MEIDAELAFEPSGPRWLGRTPDVTSVTGVRASPVGSRDGSATGVTAGVTLHLDLLGEMAVRRGRSPLGLPPSRKTRALLAYLALTGRAHRRDRLCALLWDVTEDPRAALRWSLSKLRAVVDGPDAARIVADRDTVAFTPCGATVDILELRARLPSDPDQLPTAVLLEAAPQFSGELLEGLDLPDFHEFQGWIIAEREQARTLHARVLATLVSRLADDPEAALPWARELVTVDPFDEGARARLIRLLAAAGRLREAEQHYRAAGRLFEELGCQSRGELIAVWREVRGGVRPAATGRRSGDRSPVPAAETARSDAGKALPFVGRDAERTRLIAALDAVRTGQRPAAVLLAGEPGIGKTRLLAELVEAARATGATVLEGCAFEAEAGRAYGPWMDALRRLSPQRLPAELAPLLPEVDGGGGGDGDPRRERERLFAAVAALVADRAADSGVVLLVLDDVQWLDEASAELLHYVLRTSRRLPLLLALGARDGELGDNPGMACVLSSLRRESALMEIELGPFTPEQVAALVGALSPASDPARVHASSGGNPLFAIEMARAEATRDDELPATLAHIVRERLGRLPLETADVARWAAVVGPVVGVRLLSRLVALDPDGLAQALERLERHALLREASCGRGDYGFAHEVARRVIYGSISEPRRQLMHRKIAEALGSEAGADGALAASIAHHAALAGDMATAASACIAAGERCLRVFANADALRLARRGRRYADRLEEPTRVCLLLDLARIYLAARRPEDLDAAAGHVRPLAETALDHGCMEHARLGFHMLAWLRWEDCDWSQAHRHMLQAEVAGRAADEAERATALGEMARCLALLERDMPKAEALVLEAAALARRAGIEPYAVADASGMLQLYRGNLEAAAADFRRARDLARAAGERMGEFQALERIVWLELQRGRLDEARRLAAELCRLAERLREGSEAHVAGALAALIDHGHGGTDANARLETELEGLRNVDAKLRLTQVLTRAAEFDLAQGKAERARSRAAEALAAAAALERRNECALARVLLARAAETLGMTRDLRARLRELRATALDDLSAHARESVARLLEAHRPRARAASI